MTASPAYLSVLWVGIGGATADATNRLNTMLPRLPLAITEELDARAVNQQIQRPIGAPIDRI